jgi:hypothetical protein
VFEAAEEEEIVIIMEMVLEPICNLKTIIQAILIMILLMITMCLKIRNHPTIMTTRIMITILRCQQEGMDHNLHLITTIMEEVNLVKLQVIASGLIAQPLVTLVHSRDPKLEPENIPMRMLPIIMDVLKTSWKRDPVQIFLFVNLENLQEHSTHLNGPVAIRQECMTTNSKSKIV